MVARSLLVSGLVLLWGPAAFGQQTPPPSGTPAGIVRCSDPGVVCPLPTKQVNPNYTASAYHVGIEGSVWLECVVTVTGECSDIKVVRSLDHEFGPFGLDREAVTALSQWRFTPSRKDNRPVPVLITVEMNFAAESPPAPTPQESHIAGVSGCGPATGIACPVTTKQVDPTYTREAKQAKIQGTILLECVVTPTGECSDIKVLKSLDAEHGLDGEAFKALAQWRFLPAKRDNELVPVLLTVEMTFAIERPPANQSAATEGIVYKPSDTGVVPPALTTQVRAGYTRAAMRAKVQGSVWLECIVEPTGVCSTIKVIRSLDDEYGLDEAAINALTQWRFTPGTKDGQPVRVLVSVEMNFKLKF